MTQCFFVSDLHGKTNRFDTLFQKIAKRKPEIVFIGGDITPAFSVGFDNFVEEYFFPELLKLKTSMKDCYPEIFLILGNDDPRSWEKEFMNKKYEHLFKYCHFKTFNYKGYQITGYSFIPPTPFRLKDWERFDVSRYVDPGCTAPYEGSLSVSPGEDLEYTTIEQHLKILTENLKMEKSVFLFHTPPYQTKLDRAALDGQMIDHVPLDLNVGSIAVKRFIEDKQPHITLHGHIHESSTITGYWKEEIGKTHCFTAAYENKQLALVSFILENPKENKREIL
ncbi:MAG: metallophosphoesterase [Bacteroidales bacterium]|nr:metallophosphoesterase [Bacteroidales bacterium]